MTETKTRTMPHWDMTRVFPSLDSAQFTAAFDELGRLIGELKDTFDARVDEDPVGLFDRVITRFNDISDRMREIGSYIQAFVTTEAQNDLAQARYSELQLLAVAVDKLNKRLAAWIGSLDVDVLLEGSALARDHSYFVRKAKETSAHLMSEAEEDLASSLGPAGQSAWVKLHGNVTSRLLVDVEMPDGTTQRLPMASVAGLGYDNDPAKREAGYHAALAAWPSVEVPLAAALNGVKGWNNELDRRRGWSDAIEPSLHANNIDRDTLEAMQQACIESFPDFHRYLRTKARLLGKERLPWWDLHAPIGAVGKRWEWGDTEAFIIEQFGTYSDKLAALAERAFRERWIDAEPREGKRSGGFCMGVRRDESRILVNYTEAFMDVATVAHELGHAYHNINLVDRTALQRRMPMALAETASTFCETIVTRAMFAAASPDEQLGILNGDLVRDSVITVVIHSRFLFEKALCEQRVKRDLSPAEMCKLMADAQLEVLGDTIDPDALHPYMWCVSPHYYGLPFYNWPYTFGLLFGLGLYKRYEEDPDNFRASYDELLSSTGLDDAPTLCARFGIDVRSPDFWRASLDVVRERIADFETLAS